MEDFMNQQVYIFTDYSRKADTSKTLTYIHIHWDEGPRACVVPQNGS